MVKLYRNILKIVQLLPQNLTILHHEITMTMQIF